MGVLRDFVRFLIDEAPVFGRVELTTQIVLIRGRIFIHFLFPLNLYLNILNKPERNILKTIIPKAWLKLATGIKVKKGETVHDSILAQAIP